MDGALNDYKEALKNNEGSAESYFNRGQVFMSQFNFADAHADFDKALSIDETAPKFYHGKGLAFQAQAEHYANTSGENRDLETEEVFVF
jgi:tetratricopeptide (TPR) repeat protein